MEELETNKIPFDRKEAARRLGVSVVTLDRLLAAKKIGHFRVGRRILFVQNLIDRFIETNTKNAK